MISYSYYTVLYLKQFLVVSVTFKLLLASLGGKVAEGLKHRGEKDVLSIALPLLFALLVFFFNKRTTSSIIIMLKKFAFGYI